MRRTLFLITLIVATINVVADDLIVTNDSKSIKAKIVEVSKNQIKYKDITNLNGPTFVLETSEIQTIIYENGQVQNFSQPNTTPTKTSSENTQNYTSTANFGKIVWNKDGYYLNGQKIADGGGQLETWMKKNSPSIITDYYQFQRRMTTTWKVGGLLMLPIGLASLVTGCALASGGAGDRGIFAGGVACSVIGGAMISAGIPMVVVGTVRSKRNNLVDWYNEHSHSYSQVPMQIELQSNSDGIGLALKF